MLGHVATSVMAAALSGISTQCSLCLSARHAADMHSLSQHPREKQDLRAPAELSRMYLVVLF